jgi:copper chaperone CopZ
MNSLLRSLLIALILACPLIFSNCEIAPSPNISLGADENNNKKDKKEDNLVTDSFKVGGFTCADCSNILKTSLQSHPGIVSAEINFEIDSSNINTIVKHYSNVSRKDIIKIISDTGYVAEE